MNSRRFALTVLALTAWAGWSAAQECVVKPPTGSRNGDWCEFLKSGPGILFKDPENHVLEELRLYGMLNVNYAAIDGESAGRDFWYENRGEIRRLWVGLEAKMFDNALTIHYEDRFEDDRKPRDGPREIEYVDSWATWAEWEITRTFPQFGDFGAWSIGYGKICLPLAEEVLNSSKFLAVPERSAISNRLFVLSDAVTPTGAWLRWKNGPWKAMAGVYSTDTAPEMGNWADGTAYIAQLERDAKDWFCTDAATLAAAFYYDDTTRGDDRLSGDMNWVASVWGIVQEGPWTFRANAVYGEGDDANPLRDGRFWGFVFTPSYILIPDKLEAVMRYQYQGSDNPEGVRLYSRYSRTAGLPDNENIPLLAGGRGDEHHSIYAGLNWLVCSHNLKLMAGLEWESMDSRSARVYDGLTFWLGLRSFF
jgi:hypothetical protein